MRKQIFFTFSILALSIFSTIAQTDKKSDLINNLKKQDSLFFKRGFNQCDLDYLKNHIAIDLKFYHDQSGIESRDICIENTKKYICGDTTKKPIRKVVEESLEVFPMCNNGVLYGAIKSGIHDFYIREKNKADIRTSRAKFTHLYLLENGIWLLKEVLSFDHNELSKTKIQNTFEKKLKIF